MPIQFDAIIIGTGQAGPSMAQKMTQEGLKNSDCRKKIVWRHLCQCWLYSDKDTGSKCTGGAHGPSRQRFWNRY